MNTIRDIFCTECETVTQDVIALPVSMQTCDTCLDVTEHRDMCNGGCGYRFRENDFPDDPRFWRGQVTAMPAQASYDGKPVTHATTGEVMHDLPRFKGDKRDERRDRLYHATDTKRGTTPIYIDQKAKG